MKPCGLVQQLILRMLRDLIVQYSDSHLLNGNNFHDHLLKILACLLWCLEFNQVIILWKVSKRNYKDWKPNLLLPLLTLLELYLYLQTFFLIFSSYSFNWNYKPWYAMCTNIRQNRQFHFLGLTLSKNGFRVENSKN